MNQPDHGSSYGSELEPPAHSAPPPATEATKQGQNTVVDAGLRSLDHCMSFLSCSRHMLLALLIAARGQFEYREDLQCGATATPSRSPA